jgi:cyclopropane fatty-acyl-phospholipid synthase-like methyltransferase
MNIDDRGFWKNDTAAGHQHDFELCKAIMDLCGELNVKTLVDFGCGTGAYIKFIKEIGIDVEGYDGNPFTPKISGGVGSVLDLSSDFNLNKKFDMVMSLEVGEHIPVEFEDVFIDNICRHSNQFLLLSWAIVGQGGDGHVNCRNNDYIIEKLKERNFEIMETESNILRNKSTKFWFKNTIMLFKNKN